MSQPTTLGWLAPFHELQSLGKLGGLWCGENWEGSKGVTRQGLDIGELGEAANRLIGCD